MDNRVTFLLAQSPIQVQITHHITNLKNCYDKRTVIKLFKLMLLDLPINAVYDHDMYHRIVQIINYYGKNSVQEWFEMIYGWSFQKEA